MLGDIRVAEGLVEPLKGCDVVVHLATRSRGSLEEMRGPRVTGCQALVAAAEHAGVRRVVVGSGYWLYRDCPGVLTEASPIAPIAMPRINFDTEEVARTAAKAGKVQAVIMRPGMVYGDGSWFREMVDEIRAGEYQYLGDGSSYWSPVSLEDAGEAFRAVCEHWTPGETYLVVDDDPVPIRDFSTFVARQLHAPPPRSLRWEDAARDWEPEVAEVVAANRRASNAKLKQLGWTPRVKSYTTGVPEVLRKMAAREAEGSSAVGQ